MFKMNVKAKKAVQIGSEKKKIEQKLILNKLKKI